MRGDIASRCVLLLNQQDLKLLYERRGNWILCHFFGRFFFLSKVLSIVWIKHLKC